MNICLNDSVEIMIQRGLQRKNNKLKVKFEE